MKTKRILGTGLAVSLVASIGLVLGQPAHAGHNDSSFGNTVRVDCDDGESINRAIRRSSLAEKLTITVRGTCVENVVIDRDHVTLQPSKWSGGSIEAEDETKPVISITGDHVTVQDFNGDSISGGTSGIAVIQGGEASIINNHLHGNRFGVILIWGGIGLLEGNLIEDNDQGVNIGFSSMGRFRSNDISSNDTQGVFVGGSSTAWFQGGNVVSDNGASGVLFLGIAAVRVDANNTFAGNGVHGIDCGVNGDLIIKDIGSLVFDDGPPPNPNVGDDIHVGSNCNATGVGP